MVEALLHLQMPDERPRKFLLPVIVLAFAVRVTIALLLLMVFFLTRRLRRFHSRLQRVHFCRRWVCSMS